MNQVLAFFLVVFVVILVLGFVTRYGSRRSFRQEFAKVRQSLLDKSLHPNCERHAQRISAIITTFDLLASAGDRSIRRRIPSRRWSRLLDYPQWLDEILTAVGEQGFLWPLENQLKGLKKGLEQIYIMVFQEGPVPPSSHER